MYNLSSESMGTRSIKMFERTNSQKFSKLMKTINPYMQQAHRTHSHTHTHSTRDIMINC